MRLLLVMALMSVPAPAFALSCLFGVNGSLPADGAVDVPLNVTPRVMITGAGDQSWTAELVATDLSVVEVEVERLRSGTEALLVVTPTAELTADTLYEMRVFVDGEFFGEEGAIRFRTGDAVDNEPPAVAAIIEAYRNQEANEWGDIDQVIVDVGASNEPVFHQLEFDPTPSFPSVDPVWGMSEDGSARSVWGGDGLCQNTGLIPDLRGGELRITTFDMAGNAAETQVLSGDEVARGGCACNSASSPAGVMVFGVALGLIGLRRRRR
ncbi:MAG: Ig-like domain-containing protein [Myxococcota bacterium]